MNVPPSSLPRVTGVTVTYGSRAKLCADTILGALDAGCQHVIVVFNGCADSVIGEVQQLTGHQTASVTKVINPVNLGSAGGFNAGMRAALAQCPDLVWLLDDDNYAEPGSLSAAVEELRTRAVESTDETDIAIFCNRSGSPDHARLFNGWPPRLVFPPPGSFMYFDVWQRVSRLLVWRGRHERVDNVSRRQISVPYGPYGGLLVSPVLIRRVGLPDSSLFLYEDDTDYSYRLGHAKAQMFWCRDAFVTDQDGKWSEKNGQSGLYGVAATDDSQRLYMATRNRSTFDLKRARTSPLLVVRLSVNFAIYLIMFSLSALRSRHVKNIPLFVRAAIKGFARELRQSVG